MAATRILGGVVMLILLTVELLRWIGRPPCGLVNVHLLQNNEQRSGGDACPGGSDCMLSGLGLSACFGPLCLKQKGAPGNGRSTPVLSVDIHRGHEWLGGAVGFAEQTGTERRYVMARAPRNASLLLLGIVSGSKNFDVRNWLRRAYWLQQPWQHGINWRFVIGTALPRGDNDRVSLHYEVARHEDVDLVRGSEEPPRQARVALRWWLHAATQAAALRPAIRPRYIGLAYDSVLISLPRVALRLQLYAQGLPLRPGAPTTIRRLLYAGSLRWATWADDADGETWRCVSASAPRALLEARLVGETPLPANPLGVKARKQAGKSWRYSSSLRGAPSTFLAASPELQLLSTPLLLRVRSSLAAQLHLRRLEVQPPPELWGRSLAFHQSPSGRTPSWPALLAATALAHAVHNVTSGLAIRGASASASASASTSASIGYLQLHASTNVGAFTWKADPHAYPGSHALLARSVTDGVIAEAVAERFNRQSTTAAGRVRCEKVLCASWGASAHHFADATCCDETQVA